MATAPPPRVETGFGASAPSMAPLPVLPANAAAPSQQQQQQQQQQQPPPPRSLPPCHHALNGAFTFWVLRRQKKGGGGATAEAASAGAAPGTDVEDYEKALKRVASFDTVEGFWAIYGHLMRPTERVQGTTDLHLFRAGIRPVWEDPSNKRGGKWTIKIRKGLGARYWEATVLALVGEQFGDLSSEACGVVVSVRHGEDVLSLWVRNTADVDAIARFREMLKKALRLPNFVPIEYKPHDSSGPSGPGEAPRVPAWRARSRGGHGFDSHGGHGPPHDEGGPSTPWR